MLEDNGSTSMRLYFVALLFVIGGMITMMVLPVVADAAVKTTVTAADLAEVRTLTVFDGAVGDPPPNVFLRITRTIKEVAVNVVTINPLKQAHQYLKQAAERAENVKTAALARAEIDGHILDPDDLQNALNMWQQGREKLVDYQNQFVDVFADVVSYGSGEEQVLKSDIEKEAVRVEAVLNAFGECLDGESDVCADLLGISFVSLEEDVVEHTEDNILYEIHTFLNRADGANPKLTLDTVDGIFSQSDTERLYGLMSASCQSAQDARNLIKDAVSDYPEDVDINTIRGQMNVGLAVTGEMYNQVIDELSASSEVLKEMGDGDVFYCELSMFDLDTLQPPQEEEVGDVSNVSMIEDVPLDVSMVDLNSVSSLIDSIEADSRYHPALKSYLGHVKTRVNQRISNGEFTRQRVIQRMVLSNMPAFNLVVPNGQE